MSAVSAPTISRPHDPGRHGAPVLPVAVARALAFIALSAWGALHWMSMLEPAEPGRGWAVVGVGVLAIARWWPPAGSRAEGGRSPPSGAILPLAALMLLAGRVPDELVLPGGWSELAGGISRGISDLPACACPTAGSTSGCGPCCRWAARCSSWRPRCWRSGRGARSSASPSPRCCR